MQVNNKHQHVNFFFQYAPDIQLITKEINLFSQLNCTEMLLKNPYEKQNIIAFLIIVKISRNVIRSKRG